MTSCWVLQAQIVLDIQLKFVSPTARLHLGRWEKDEVSSLVGIFAY